METNVVPDMGFCPDGRQSAREWVRARDTRIGAQRQSRAPNNRRCVEAGLRHDVISRSGQDFETPNRINIANFFRKWPADAADETIAALQGFETSLFLIALGRFPHALTSCAAAIEAALKASPRCATSDDRFVTLLDAACRASAHIANFPKLDLTDFRKKRNDIVHKGFSPKDDNIAADLQLKVGIPLIAACFREFHTFDFYDGLLPEYSRHIQIAQKAYQRRPAGPNDASDRDVTYCFRSLAHLIRWSFKEAFSSSWELKALTHAEEIGMKFNHANDEQAELERLFGCAWKFECPVCHDYESTVAELEEGALSNGFVRPTRLACTNCGLVVRNNHYFLAEELLAADVQKRGEQRLC
jgi:hypothetical protein